MDSSGSGKVHMAGICEHGNDASGFIHYAEFLDELSSSEFVQESATGRQLDATFWIAQWVC
jgi:hypothetical protein